jgi:hypothetical protein
MPKRKAANKTNDGALRVGLPDVPSLYGLKARKQYLHFSHAEKRLADSRNYWICSARPDGRPIPSPSGASGLTVLFTSEPPARHVKPAILPTIPPSPSIWNPGTMWSLWKEVRQRSIFGFRDIQEAGRGLSFEVQDAADDRARRKCRLSRAPPDSARLDRKRLSANCYSLEI